MKLQNQLHSKPFSNKTGCKVLNSDQISIFDLDQQEIMTLFKSYGALLFRGFDSDVETFIQFSNSLSKEFIDYSNGYFNRRVINNNPTLLSVNDLKDEIKLHGEMYYLPNHPPMLWFFCATPPVESGETIICDGRKIFSNLSDETKNLFTQKKLKYVNHLEKEAWQERYKTDDLKLVKDACAKNQRLVKLNEDESIDILYICPAIYETGEQKELTFIGSLLPAKSLHPEIISFDDGSEINEQIISEIDEVTEEITTEIAWKKGDILMIDNNRVMHGRRKITDDTRDIYIRLCSPVFPF